MDAHSHGNIYFMYKTAIYKDDMYFIWEKVAISFASYM